jgi:uncharacterized OB-fold protein
MALGSTSSSSSAASAATCRASHRSRSAPSAGRQRSSTCPRTGTVYTYTIVHRAGSAAFAAETPYAIVLVDLDEGVRVMSNMVNCEPEQVSIGMPVRMVFEDVNDEVTLYKFEPA